MTEAKDNNVLNLCEKIIEDGKLTYDEVYDLSELVNQTINKCDGQLVKWPTNLLIKPLQEVWKDGALDIEELNIIAELLVSIVYNSELENVNNIFAKLEFVPNIRCFKNLCCEGKIFAKSF